MFFSPQSEKIGSIKAHGGATVPAGWLGCDGAAVSRTTYAALFAEISTGYGVGDGATTFNVPDFRGRAVLGVGTGSGLTARARGATGGAETHELTTGEGPSHEHPHSVGNGAGAYPGFIGTSSSGGNNNAGQGTVTMPLTGSNSPHNNVQPFGVATMIIKATG